MTTTKLNAGDVANEPQPSLTSCNGRKSVPDRTAPVDTVAAVFWRYPLTVKVLDNDHDRAEGLLSFTLDGAAGHAFGLLI